MGVTPFVLVEGTIAALSLGGIYALTALGFVIIYRATRVFNFAQGTMMALGAYFVVSVIALFQLPTLLAMVIACLLSALLGLVTYWVVIRPMTTQPLFATIIVTMGVSIMYSGAIGVIWGPVDRFITTPITGVQRLGEFPISNYSTAVFGACAVMCVGLLAFFRYSRIGLQMRATAENGLLASQRGISLNWIFALTWSLAGFAAGVAGMLYAGNTSASPTIAELGLRAFPAALVGGFDSVGGALVGGVIVAFAETAAAVIWGSEARNVVAFALLLVIMLLRPNGLFGRPEAIGRV
jgi:branched-chain amino acid transport system permease protein